MLASAIRDKLRRQVGNPTTTQVTDADMLAFVNLGYRHLANRYRFRQMRSRTTVATVASQRAYTLPAGAGSILRVRDTTNQVKLTKLGDRRAAELLDVDVTGKPTNYILYDTTYELHPTPDGVYNIELYYKLTITDLAAGDTPLIPESWHPGILTLAKYYYWDDQGDLVKATAALNLFNAWVREQPVELDEEKSDLDSGVELPTLGGSTKGLDFDHSDG